MNRKRITSLLWKVSLLACVGVGIGVFQNCSQPANGLSASDSLQASADKIDFAYDATIDQIAYMSCPLLTGGYDQNTYFTIRAGAYSTGGLKLSDTFYTKYGHKPADLLGQLLSQSGANKNTVLQLAIRKTANLNSVINATGTPQQGIDYDNFLDTLGSMSMTESLVANGYDYTTHTPTEARTRYLRNGTQAGVRMEANIRINTSESTATDIRNNYLNTGLALLALTYVEPSTGNTPTNVRTPNTVFPTLYSSISSQAYGIGYNLLFTQPPGAVGFQQNSSTSGTATTVAYPSNLLTSVQEKNLVSPGTTSGLGTWSCPTNLRYRIVRNASDAGASGTAAGVGQMPCVRTPDPLVLTGDLAILRRSLRVENWWIDTVNKCIMPKNDVAPGCYGSLNYVNYNFSDHTTGCDPYSSSASSTSSTSTSGTTVTTTTSGNSLQNPACVAWLSICTR